MDSDQIISMVIGMAGLALVYYGCYYSLKLPKRVSTVIAFAFGIITTVYLWENPTVLADTKAKIALAVIVALLSVAFSIRRIFS